MVMILYHCLSLGLFCENLVFLNVFTVQLTITRFLHYIAVFVSNWWLTEIIGIFCKWPPTLISVRCTLNQLNVYLWYANIWHVPLGIVSYRIVGYCFIWLVWCKCKSLTGKIRHLAFRRRRVIISKVLKWFYTNTFLDTKTNEIINEEL